MYVPTIEDVLQPYCSYPKAIQQAILRVESHPSFSILTKAAKKVVKSLLTRANQHNAEVPIKARLDLVADSAEVSYKTVQRTMSLLKTIGWITTISEGRTEWGVYTSMHYRFSSDFCCLVNLPTKNKFPEDLAQETKMSDGAVYVDLSFKEDQRKISIKNQNTKPITLPDALREIETFGIKESGICKLRGIAYSAGYQLEHIWIVAKERCQNSGIQGGRLYRYLLAMILKTSDYAGRAAQVGRIETTNAEQKDVTTKKISYRYKTFVGQGVKVRVFDGVAEVSTLNGHIKTIVGRSLLQIYADIENGKLIDAEKLVTSSQARPQQAEVPLQSQVEQSLAIAEKAFLENTKQLPKTQALNMSLMKSILNIRRNGTSSTSGTGVYDESRV
jgi:hypothetical protein